MAQQQQRRREDEARRLGLAVAHALFERYTCETSNVAEKDITQIDFPLISPHARLLAAAHSYVELNSC